MNRYGVWTAIVFMMVVFFTLLLAKPTQKMGDRIPFDAGVGSSFVLATDATVELTSDGWFALEANGKIFAPTQIEEVYQLTLKEIQKHDYWQVKAGSPHIEMSPINDFNYVDAKVGRSSFDFTTAILLLWLFSFCVWFIVIAMMMELDAL